MKFLARLLALFLGTLAFVQPAAPDSLLTITKTPFEAFNCGIDFTPVAGPNGSGSDGITLIGVLSNNLLTGANTTPVIIASSPAPLVQALSDIVIFRVQGGIAGQSHVISVRVRDNITGEIFEGQVTLVISTADGPR